MNRCRQNNDVIIKKDFTNVQNKIPYKTYIFRIFPILRSNKKAPFCNLFIERPSYNENSEKRMWKCQKIQEAKNAPYDSKQ